MILLLLALQAPVSPLPLFVRQGQRTDSLQFLPTWGASQAATSYNVRLITSTTPDPGTVDFNAALVWHGLPATSLADTITVANPHDSTDVRIAVRACNAAGCSRFTFSSPHWYKAVPPVTGPLVEGFVQRRMFALLTFRNGSLGVWTVDSADTRVVVVSVASTVADSLGRLRGATYVLTRDEANRAAASLADLATALQGGRYADTLHAQIDERTLGGQQVRCSGLTGCWGTFTNVGMSGSWTTSPRLKPVYLWGLVSALRDAARGDTVLVASDSLPYRRVVQ